MPSRTSPTYLTAAVLVRSMDAGATVGIVLLCSASRMASPLRTAGLLGAALTAPHVLGFLSAPVLDRARNPRVVIGLASASFGVFLALAAWGLATWPLLLVFALCLCAGAAGPMLTGGLSSLVDGTRSDHESRRNRALDALTYGFAGAAAPAVVAVIATLVSPRGALLLLAGLGVVGAVLVLRVPSSRPSEREASTRSASLLSGLSAIWREPPLRQVATLTWLAAFVVAAAVLVGMAMGERAAAGHGGWVAAAFGAGGLVGGVVLTVHPPRTEPVRGMLRWVGLVVPVLGVGAVLGHSFAILLAVFGTLGLVVAPQTVLSLAARGEYSPVHSRGTVFVTVAGTKVAFSSAGTAAAGLSAGMPPRQSLALLAAATVAAVAMGVLVGGRKPSKVDTRTGQVDLGKSPSTVRGACHGQLDIRQDRHHQG